jgi:hypothetical protein
VGCDRRELVEQEKLQNSSPPFINIVVQLQKKKKHVRKKYISVNIVLLKILKDITLQPSDCNVIFENTISNGAQRRMIVVRQREIKEKNLFKIYTKNFSQKEKFRDLKARF